jgi:hypothetical protein
MLEKELRGPFPSISVARVESRSCYEIVLPYEVLASDRRCFEIGLQVFLACVIAFAVIWAWACLQDDEDFTQRNLQLFQEWQNKTKAFISSQKSS